MASVSARQFYIFFGLVELNEVDSQRYAEDSVSYDIYTGMSFSDLLISAVLWPLTVTTRTVTVDR